MSRLGRVGVAVLVLAALVGCSNLDPAPSEQRALSGQAGGTLPCPPPGPLSTSTSALPDLVLPCLGTDPGAGLPVPLRRLTGRPVVLNLWASWCRPCREELPAFAALDRAAGARLRVLGVASQDRPEAAVAYAADAGLPFPSLLDESGDLGRALRRPALPVTVLIAADGSVAKVYQGPPLTGATLRTLVRDELGVDV